MLDRAQRFVWAMVVGGFLLTVASLALIVVVVGDGSFRWVFGGGNTDGHNFLAYLLLGLSGIGVLMLITGIFFGLASSRSNDAKKPIQKAENVQVIALLINNEDDQPVFDTDMYEPHELTCYVQIAMPNGDRREFKTDYSLLLNMGEGLMGDITYQGRWLCSFVRKLPPAQQAGPDPFVR